VGVAAEEPSLKLLEVTRETRGEGRLLESWEEMEVDRLTSREFLRRMCKAEAILLSRVRD